MDRRSFLKGVGGVLAGVCGAKALGGTVAPVKAPAAVGVPVKVSMKPGPRLMTQHEMETRLRRFCIDQHESPITEQWIRETKASEATVISTPMHEDLTYPELGYSRRNEYQNEQFVARLTYLPVLFIHGPCHAQVLNWHSCSSTDTLASLLEDGAPPIRYTRDMRAPQFAFIGDVDKTLVGWLGTTCGTESRAAVMTPDAYNRWADYWNVPDRMRWRNR